ncbi:Pimeloyl-ACP methyl ester carboxylesterase [Amycolatopsis xylanica]|uniref:Pimeloyl-ACP methyl ester carboxylesterase n=1 Tax=Amycolatopsis xylanica TaxID=589385 RepID=A0A1H3R5S6_9PSEU|nr:alpha/beta hydrolase [Amycolatopsis xylanica]SDZ20956.1 Pimeloyl-ACP methyl ester carboxylesterase [Amycolatopsis xylanica]
MLSRRTFGRIVGAGAVASVAGLPSVAAAAAAPVTGDARPARGLGPIRQIKTDVLDMGYHEVGPANGEAVLLGHGWPYSPQAYAEVAPELARRGYRVLVPYLRGHGTTRFLSASTFRSGQQAALGSDMIAFLDALGVKQAIFGGYDWGGRALNVAAALWPERCLGLVSVNNYLVQNLALAQMPDPAATEAAHWYYFYFLTERGRAGLTANTRDLARVVWTKNSPLWRFTDADFEAAAALFDNPDYVDIVLHVYRHRLLTEPGDPRYDALEAQLAKQPKITMPAVTLDGIADGSVPATDGTATAKFFAGPRVHHQVPGAGHNLPQERPRAFVNAVLEVASLRK